jgi:hypothetical protein
MSLIVINWSFATLAELGEVVVGAEGGPIIINDFVAHRVNLGDPSQCVYETGSKQSIYHDFRPDF